MDPFLKQILKYWAETSFLNQVNSQIMIQEQVLWFNSFKIKQVSESIFASRSKGLVDEIHIARGACLYISETERRVPARQHSTVVNWFTNDAIN